MDAIDYKTIGREAMHDSMKKGLATTMLAGAATLTTNGMAPLVLGGGRATSLLDTYRAAKNNATASIMDSYIPKIDGRLAALNALNEAHAEELIKLKNNKVPNIKKYLPAAAAVGIGAPAALGEIEHLKDADKEKRAFIDPFMLSLVGGGALATTLLMNMRGARKGIEEGKANIQAKQNELSQVEQQHNSLTKEVEQAKINNNSFGSLKHPGTWAAAAAIPLVGYGAYKWMKGEDKEKQASIIQEDKQMNQLDQVYEQVLMKLASLNSMQKQASTNQLDVIYGAVMEKLAFNKKDLLKLLGGTAAGAGLGAIAHDMADLSGYLTGMVDSSENLAGMIGNANHVNDMAAGAANGAWDGFKGSPSIDSVPALLKILKGSGNAARSAEEAISDIAEVDLGKKGLYSSMGSKDLSELSEALAGISDFKKK